MIAGSIEDIPEFIDFNSLKVHAPTSVIFVCGGSIDVTKPPQSLRDAFLRIAQGGKFSKYDIRRAEDMEDAFPHGEYKELLQFESDVAQISELILLFSESAGSIAELGAFVMDDEIAPKMLVVVDDVNYADDSFIKLGPLYTLMNARGEETVCIIKLSDHKLKSISDVSDIDLTTFAPFISGPFFERLSKPSSARTFNENLGGHIIKLLTGLIQYYASLTLVEIEVLLISLNIKIPKDRILQFLRCADVFGWIKIERLGITTFYSAVAPKVALHFELADPAVKLDRARWRTDVLEYWRINDVNRFSCISSAARSSVR